PVFIHRWWPTGPWGVYWMTSVTCSSTCGAPLTPGRMVNEPGSQSRPDGRDKHASEQDATPLDGTADGLLDEHADHRAGPRKGDGLERDPGARARDPHGGGAPCPDGAVERWGGRRRERNAVSARVSR